MEVKPITRLEWFGRDPLHIHYPHDIARLKEKIPQLEIITRRLIQKMYSEWSESVYCAGWLALSPEGIHEFEKWLLEEIDPSDGDLDG